MAKISVLVMVYNEERYLRKCLDSLVAQTFGDFEAICVNDASTDASLDILRQYAAADARFRIINNAENIGTTKSRSKALAAVTGEYVVLLDADDFLSTDALDEAMRSMARTGSDMALFDLQMYYNDADIKPYTTEQFPETMPGVEACKLCVRGRLHGLYLGRRALYEQMAFDDSRRLYTDDNTATVHLFLSRTVSFCRGIYYYRRHAASETHKMSIRRFDYLIANLHLKEELVSRGARREDLVDLEIHRWKNIVAHYSLYQKNKSLFSAAEKQEIFRTLQTCRDSIDFTLLPLRLKLRPPYWPARNAQVFAAYQAVYAAFRKVKRLFK